MPIIVRKKDGTTISFRKHVRCVANKECLAKALDACRKKHHDC